MSKKKNAHIERNTQKKLERQALHQKLENFIVKHTGIALILAVLFTVFGNYKNVFTNGMPILFNILIWAGVAVVLVFAILGTVKKNPSLYKWCAVGAANSVLWYIFMNLGANFGAYTSGVAHCYYAIALYFLFCLAFYFLAYYGAWNKKAVRITFYVLAAVFALLWLTSASVFLYKQVAPYIFN
ncbi:MAG: hypothetical protein IKL74_05560 [Clostridia bacterium]|nr:hypothetical protein [Clostridia bacterium]